MTFTLGPKAISAGYGLAAFDQIGSTNAEAMSRARNGERGPMWFVTTEQTAGRGRRQRAWIAPRGNLASSVLEVMDVSPAVAATMSFAFGLAHECALQRVSVEANLRLAGSDQLKYLLKWPNDILVRGQKLCGLLVEAEAVTDGGLAVVAGIGTNIIAAPEGTPTPATSLAALGVHVGGEGGEVLAAQRPTLRRVLETELGDELAARIQDQHIVMIFGPVKSREVGDFVPCFHDF